MDLFPGLQCNNRLSFRNCALSFHFKRYDRHGVLGVIPRAGDNPFAHSGTVKMLDMVSKKCVENGQVLPYADFIENDVLFHSCLFAHVGFVKAFQTSVFSYYF
jgi:hypothetical protein